MTVAEYVAPNYTDAAQTASIYKANIDAACSVMSNVAAQFAPHAKDTPDMAILVDAGSIMLPGGVLVSQAQQTSSTLTAPATNPRIDRVVIDATDGTISVVAGTEAASPAAPSIPAGKLPCCQISLTTASTSITNAMITDERSFTARAQQAADDYAATSGTDTYTATLSPALASYTTGARYRAQIGNANTSTTPTVDFGPGAKTIKRPDGSALKAGDLPASWPAEFFYDGTDMLLLNPAITPLDSIQRIEASANTFVDLGTVNAGDRIFYSVWVPLSIGASVSAYAGAIIKKTSGTSTVQFCNGLTQVEPQQYCSSVNTDASALFSGIAKVTAAGTCVFGVSATSLAGTNSGNITVGTISVHAIVLNNG